MKFLHRMVYVILFSNGDDFLLKNIWQGFCSTYYRHVRPRGLLLIDRDSRFSPVNPDSIVGIYTYDPKAYNVFRRVFDPVIEEYHSGFRTDDVHSDLDWGESEKLSNLYPRRKHVIFMWIA